MGYPGGRPVYHMASFPKIRRFLVAETRGTSRRVFIKALESQRSRYESLVGIITRFVSPFYRTIDRRTADRVLPVTRSINNRCLLHDTRLVLPREFNTLSRLFACRVFDTLLTRHVLGSATCQISVFAYLKHKRTSLRYLS